MESKEFMSLVEAAMSVVINEDHMKGKEVIVFGKRGMVIKEVGSDGDTENDEIYQVKFEDGTVKNVPARDMEMQSDKREHSENELEDITNESVELGEAINRGNEAFWKEIHIELKKVMDNKYYREFRSSNGGQALDNVISHFGKARGWRVDRVVKEIIDKYGRNRDEYIKLSFAMAARSKIRESVEHLDEAQKRTFNKGDRVVGRRGNFKGEEAKVVRYDWRLGELTVAVAGKKVRVNPSDWNKIKESVELDEAFDMKKMLKIFNKLKKNDKVRIKYDSSVGKGKEFQTFVVTSPKRPVGKKGVERVIMKHVDNPTGVKYTLYNRDGSVSLAIGDMAASMTDIKESVGCGGCGCDTEHSFLLLDEGLVLASDDLNAVKKAAQKLSKQSPDLTYYVVKHKDRHFKGKEIPYYEVYASVDWHKPHSMGFPYL